MKKVVFLWFCFFVILFSCNRNGKNNKEPIYEKTEADIEITLESIEEKNNAKIPDNISVSYKYEILINGLYILNEVFELQPLYINYDNPRSEQYISFTQLENLLFFYNAVGSNKHLLFDLLTKKITTLEIDKISYIRFVSKNKLIIYGTTCHNNWNGGTFMGTIDKDEIIEIEFNNRNTSNENIGINITGEYEWGKESYMPPINESRYQTEYLYNIFDKYIIIDCNNIIPKDNYPNLEFHYIKQLNKYIFWVDNFGGLK
jgi:hypothetical protein